VLAVFLKINFIVSRCGAYQLVSIVKGDDTWATSVELNKKMIWLAGK